MKVSILGLFLLGATVAFAQAPAPASNAPSAPQPAAQAPAPNTPTIIKERLRIYQKQQKEAGKLAKLQTKLALEELKMQQLH